MRLGGRGGGGGSDANGGDNDDDLPDLEPVHHHLLGGQRFHYFSMDKFINISLKNAKFGAYIRLHIFFTQQTG